MKYRHIGFIVLSMSYLYLGSQLGLSFMPQYIEDKGFDFFFGYLLGSLLFTVLPLYYIAFAVIDRIKKKPTSKSPII